MAFALALFVNLLFGYTINRVTLFALILTLRLVVDDPITNVDNIQRHIRMGKRDPRAATLAAVQEVLPPVIMSTLTVVASCVPLCFITWQNGSVPGPGHLEWWLVVGCGTAKCWDQICWLAALLFRWW